MAHLNLAVHSRILRSLAAAVLAVPLWIVPARAEEVRIQVFGLFAPTEFRLRAEDSRILLVRAESGHARIEGRQTAECRVAAARVICQVEGHRIEGAFVEALSEGAAAGFQLAVPGKIERHFQGRLELTAAGRAMQAVVVMDREAAVRSIVAAESVPGAALAALQAQAVVVRSYLLAGPRHENFEFCDTTHCQFLRGPVGGDHPAGRATTATQGLVLTYGGEVLRALYSRSCGGATQTLQQAGLEAEGYPYFRVACESCRREPEKWQAAFNRETIQPVLEQPTEAKRLAVARQHGWSQLPSARFRFKTEGDSVVLDGTGIGHGIGLCQKGSASLAAAGLDFGTILRHYFPNTRLDTLPHDSP